MKPFRKRCQSLTKSRNDLRLQDKLIAESRSNESLRTGIRRTPNPVPHVSTRKHQDRHDAHRSPEEARGEEWRKVLIAQKTDGEDKGDDHGRDNVGDRVEGLVDFEFVGSERCDPIVQVAQFEATVRKCISRVRGEMPC